MKKIKILGIVAITVAFLASCVHLGDLNLEPIPDIDFTVESSGLTLTFTSTVQGTSDIKWDIVSLGTGTGDTFSYTFPKPGTYWVSMTGTYKGQQQTVSTKVMVAKPAKVSMTDNTVRDWDNVTYPDFIFTGEEGYYIQLKVDYDANFVYMYVKWDTNAPKADVNEAILNLRIDSDDNKSTGISTKGVGADFYYEGNIFGDEPWGDWYIPKDGDWDWDETTTNAMITGHREVTEDEFVEIEFALPRKTFGITGTSFSFYSKFYHCDWDDSDIAHDSDGNTVLKINMDKME